MHLQPVARRSVPDEVYDQLLGELMAGDMAAGERLPSERRLAEVLGVSRPAVREALQRLSHAGYVEVRQGDTTTVRDFRRHGGLDLLPRLLVVQGRIDLTVARSILEARAYVGPRIAQLAAERGGTKLAKPLQHAVEALESDLDPVARQRAALDYWQVLVDGADSIAFRLMFNSMRAAYLPLIDALASVMSAEVDQIDTYRRLAEAVSSGDGGTARDQATQLLTSATDALTSMIDTLQEDPS
ncbi:FadR/GntR family transcriptional regulator [Amycolatopsis benzoatilytica]|uniref:FadR/GntR family transcriptional regulator n=1 Tax=Amycolatopsis benzoatilytica TaxID=346045 RepID=UPI00035E4D2C|nr:GntR family transcriptional regulator [Amycolatopsis benzoatilytica]